MLPRKRRGRCLLVCVSWAGRSSFGGSRCSAAPGSRALGRFGATADGKICASCMIRSARAAKRAPSWQDLRAVYSPTAICRAFRIHGTHILPKPAHFEYTAAIHCHEGALFPSEAFLDTPGQNIAIVRHPGTHNVNISPPPGAWECISRARGNAVGCRQHRLQGQLRCKSTNEPVHSNIFPLRY